MANKNYYPLLPLRGLFIFPTMILHIDIGRERSIAALNEAMKREEKLFLTAQKEIAVEQPGEEDIYAMGILAHIKQIVKLPIGIESFEDIRNS